MTPTKSIIVSAAILLSCMMSCKNATPALKTAPLQAKNTLPLIKPDTVQVKESIVEFLQWYKLNYKKANAFPILTKDSNENYVVSHTGYINYLNFIKSSPYISAEYISYWKTYFDDKEKELREYPIKTVVPEGFDFDIVLVSQKPEDFLNRLDKLHYNITSMTDTVALVALKFPHAKDAAYEIEMVKTKSAWQIGFIATPNYD